MPQVCFPSRGDQGVLHRHSPAYLGHNGEVVFEGLWTEYDEVQLRWVEGLETSISALLCGLWPYNCCRGACSL